MAQITSTYSSKFHNIENLIFQLSVKRAKEHNTFPGIPGAVAVATEMVKAFHPIHQAFVNDQIGRREVTEWLLQLNATPIEISEIIEGMEENKGIVYNARKRRVESYKNRGTGE